MDEVMNLFLGAHYLFVALVHVGKLQIWDVLDKWPLSTGKVAIRHEFSIVIAHC